MGERGISLVTKMNYLLFCYFRLITHFRVSRETYISTYLYTTLHCRRSSYNMSLSVRDIRPVTQHSPLRHGCWKIIMRFFSQIDMSLSEVKFTASLLVRKLFTLSVSQFCFPQLSSCCLGIEVYLSKIFLLPKITFFQLFLVPAILIIADLDRLTKTEFLNTSAF